MMYKQLTQANAYLLKKILALEILRLENQWQAVFSRLAEKKSKDIRNAIQRYLEKLEKCTQGNLMKFNKAKSRCCTLVRQTPGVNTGWG